MHGSRGCLRCCTKPPLVVSVDEPSKGLKTRGQRVKKQSLTEDFWSPSSGDMENSAFPSYRSISSISTSNQTLDTHSSIGDTSNSTDSVNQGLLLWNQTRQQWVGNKGSEKPRQAQEAKLSFKATYESLLGTNKPFPQSIPLTVSFFLPFSSIECLLALDGWTWNMQEMVEFLVDVWEQEGLYD